MTGFGVDEGAVVMPDKNGALLIGDEAVLHRLDAGKVTVLGQAESLFPGCLASGVVFGPRIMSAARSRHPCRPRPDTQLRCRCPSTLLPNRCLFGSDAATARTITSPALPT